MKKTLIALAAVAVSGAAFAESTVTMGGLLEIAPLSNTKVTTSAAPGAVSVSNKNSQLSRVNSWGTSVLSITATEDLGGGLRASAVLITQPGAAFAAREHTLGLSGDFGTVRWGRFVPAASAGFHALSGAGSATLAGSIYGVTTGGDGFMGRTGLTSFERQDNVLQYTSPNFSGFTVNAALVSNSTDRSEANRPGANKTRQTSLHLGYSSGPIAAGIGLNRRTTEREAAPLVNEAFGAGGGLVSLEVPAVTQNSTRSSLNWVAGSYDFGAVRVFAAHAQRKDAAGFPTRTDTSDISVNSFGIAVPMDALTLRASMYRGSDKRLAATDDTVRLSGYQLSATYALSKRTSVVAAMGVNEAKHRGAASTAQKTQGSTLTVQHSF